MRKWRSKSGVTLLELLLVVILIGILAAVFIPKLTVSAKKAKGGVFAGNAVLIATHIKTELSTGTATKTAMATAITGAGTMHNYGGGSFYDRDRYWSYSYNQNTAAITTGNMVGTLITDGAVLLVYNIDTTAVTGSTDYLPD